MMGTLGKLVSHTMLPGPFFQEYTFACDSAEDNLPEKIEEEYTMEIAER
jgi:hypothetical protein